MVSFFISTVLFANRLLLIVLVMMQLNKLMPLMLSPCNVCWQQLNIEHAR